MDPPAKKDGPDGSSLVSVYPVFGAPPSSPDPDPAPSAMGVGTTGYRLYGGMEEGQAD